MKHGNLFVIATVGLLGSVSASAATSAPVSSTAGCSTEMRMQTVWTAGPRSQQLARVEKRPVTVCDGKVVKQSPQVARD